MLLQIEHLSTYRFNQPVSLGTHRLMLRPMEGHDVQIRSSELIIHPAHRLRWVHDAFDNSIALVDFPDKADELRIESRITVEQFNTNPFDFIVETGAATLPFAYGSDEAPDLAPSLLRRHPEDDETLRHWVRPFLGADGKASTLEFLIALNKSVPLFFSYRRREEAGVQTPGQTLKTRSGSCRDFALLLMEAARMLGLAARYVSGYLCESGNERLEAASGATHAWAEIYLPGAGWRGFDPTCGILAADHHVRVAVTREPAQATPIRGAFGGSGAACLGMEVLIHARAVTTEVEA